MLMKTQNSLRKEITILYLPFAQTLSASSVNHPISVQGMPATLLLLKWGFKWSFTHSWTCLHFLLPVQNTSPVFCISRTTTFFILSSGSCSSTLKSCCSYCFRSSRLILCYCIAVAYFLHEQLAKIIEDSVSSDDAYL